MRILNVLRPQAKEAAKEPAKEAAKEPANEQPSPADASSSTSTSTSATAAPSTTTTTTTAATTDATVNPFVDLYYFVPRAMASVKAPRILYVIHGKGGRGKVHRDTWVPMAEAGGYVVLAPSFDASCFPHRLFQQCGVLSRDGVLQPHELRTFNVLESLFDLVCKANRW